jgi:hypothetical protein
MYPQENKNRLKKKLLRRVKSTRGTTQITENRRSGSDKPLPLTRETENPGKAYSDFRLGSDKHKTPRYRLAPTADSLKT